MTKDEYEKIIDGQQLGWSATYRDWIEKGPESSGGCDEYVDMIEEMEYRIAKLDDDVRRSRSGDEESRNGECEQAARSEESQEMWLVVEMGEARGAFQERGNRDWRTSPKGFILHGTGTWMVILVV